MFYFYNGHYVIIDAWCILLLKRGPLFFILRNLQRYVQLFDSIQVCSSTVKLHSYKQRNIRKMMIKIFLFESCPLVFFLSQFCMQLFDLPKRIPTRLELWFLWINDVYLQICFMFGVFAINQLPYLNDLFSILYNQIKNICAWSNKK